MKAQNIIKIGCYLSFILLLLLFAYIELTHAVKVDFSSFYSSLISFQQDSSPYDKNTLTFLGTSQTASVNLNTPFFVVLLSPLSYLPYGVAFILWQLGAFLALMFSLSIIFKKYHLDNPAYLLAVLFSFPVFMNFFIGQIATYVLFFITFGDQSLKRGYSKLAGFCFGFITGIKLFTGLFFFYLLAKRDLKACVSFMVIFFLTLFIPFFIDGQEIYRQYFLAIKSINWYIHAWNGSFIGYIERSQILSLVTSNIAIEKNIIAACLFLVSISYLYVLGWKKNRLKNNLFNITIIYMLLINPLSWLYYFILLLEPFAYLASKEKYFSIEKKLSCLLLFILFAYPRHSNEVKNSSEILIRLTTGSQYFYALMLTLIIFIWPTKLNSKENKTVPGYYPFLKIIVMFFVYLMIFYFTTTNLLKLVGNQGNLTQITA